MHKLVIFTAATLDEGRDIALSLVEKHLVACASIFPLVESWYLWEGELEQSSEVKIFLKTTEEHINKVIRYIKKKHSYDVPEVIVLPIEEGNEEYLRWIQTQVV